MRLSSKRLFDLTFSSAGLLVLAPILIGVAAGIKFQDHGPIFYRGERIGLKGKTFKIYKFRTMVANADKIGPASTSNTDPRITKLGNFLRAHKLDELPQLINVLFGDMSLVGPRPEVKKFVDKYTEKEKHILEVKPGITDWASIWNKDEGSVIEKSGISDPDLAYETILRPTKLDLQLKYVKEISLITDLKIIFRTIQAILDKNHDTTDIAPNPLSNLK